MDLGDASRQFASRSKGRPKTAPAGRASNPPNGDPFPPPKAPVPARTRHADSSQHPRMDAVAHYPFADSKGSAAALLSSTAARPSIFSIGAPQRRRLCDRAYAEARRTASGLLVADIPEALRGLGIQLPREIERAFLLRSLQAAGREGEGSKKGDKEDNDNSADPTAPSVYGGLVVEPVVSLRQWRCVVERYVDRERRLLERAQRGEAAYRWSQQGAGGADEDEVVAALLAEEGPDLRALLDEEGGAGIDEGENEGAVDGAPMDAFLAQSATYPPYHPPALSRSADLMDFSPEEREMVGRREAEAREAFHAALGRTVLEARARKAAVAKAPPPAESSRFARLRKEMFGTLGGTTAAVKKVRRPLVVRTTHAHRLREVQSRIGQDVRMDRRRFQHGQEMGTASALASIAKQRVEALAGADRGGWDGGLGPREREMNGSVASDARGRLADLDSGVATMTIADAFIGSDVGRQILHEQQQQASLSSFSLREAVRGEVAVAHDDDEVDAAVRAEMQFLLGQHESKASASAAAAVGGKAASSSESRTPYQGWKASKGGMSADYGHTKNSYSDLTRGPVSR